MGGPCAGCICVCYAHPCRCGGCLCLPLLEWAQQQRCDEVTARAGTSRCMIIIARTPGIEVPCGSSLTVIHPRQQSGSTRSWTARPSSGWWAAAIPRASLPLGATSWSPGEPGAINTLSTWQFPRSQTKMAFPFPSLRSPPTNVAAFIKIDRLPVHSRRVYVGIPGGSTLM